MNATFTAAQLDSLKRQRLNGRERRLLATARQAAAERDAARDALRRMRRDLHDLERARPDREKVLVVVEGDGYLTAYAEPWVDVRFVNLPKVDPANARLMELAEEIARYQLPQVYRELWDNSPSRGTASVSDCRTPWQLASGIETQNTLTALDAVGRG